MNVSFNDPEKRKEFIDWLEYGEKDNSSEMKDMRAELDRIRKIRKAMAMKNAKRHRKS